MKKSYEIPSFEIIRLLSSETITSENMWTPTLSPGIENWD